MTPLAIRRLLIDLQPPIATRWNGDDAFRTAYFNALSMSFPVGEQYFIDSVRNALQALPETQRERFAEEVNSFIGQEATHRRIHALFNGHLSAPGQPNDIERRALRRLQAHAQRNVCVHQAATAGTEHFSAIFASWLLRRRWALEHLAQRLAAAAGARRHVPHQRRQLARLLRARLPPQPARRRPGARRAARTCGAGRRGRWVAA